MAAGLVARQDLALSHGYSNAIGVLLALALLTDGAIGVMAAENPGIKVLNAGCRCNLYISQWPASRHIKRFMA